MLSVSPPSNVDVEHEVSRHAKGSTEQGDDGGEALEATGLPIVCQPTAEERATHSLTHLPYRRWCRWCVAARMRNSPHFKKPPFSRSSPLLVLDYCFIKHAGDNAWLTVLVGKVYPSRTIFAVPCQSKGPDAYVTRRLAAFFRACGMVNFTWMGGQEGAASLTVLLTIPEAV